MNAYLVGVVSNRRIHWQQPPASNRLLGMNTEIVFIVEQGSDGGYTAHAVGASIFTQGEANDQLRANVRDAVRCHLPDDDSHPKIIRLHHVRDELLAA